MCKLLLKQRNDRAVGTQHVTETSGDKLRLAVSALSVNLSNTFCRSHDVCGVDSLVGGDHHELLRTILYRQVSDYLRTEHIDEHRLIREILHQRDMFISCGMIDDLRSQVLKHLIHLIEILDVTYDEVFLHIEILIRTLVVELKLKVIDGRLRLVKHYQTLRVILKHLTANLASNGACSTGDKHHLAFQLISNILIAKHYRLSLKKVFNLNLLNLVE